MTRRTYADTILPEDYQEYIAPSVLPLLEYEQELAEEGKHIDFDWAHNEIVEHSLNWVRVGLVAHRIQFYKLWQGRFKNFRDYCKTALCKKYWQIKNLIKAAEVTITLAREGFLTLPSCESQATTLVKCCQKLEQDFATGWVDAWDTVTTELSPENITSKSIKAALGFPPEHSNILVDHELLERLKGEARDRGLSLTEMLNEDYPKEEESSEQEPSDEETEGAEPHGHLTFLSLAQKPCPQKIERWSADLEELVKEHDAQSWLRC